MEYDKNAPAFAPVPPEEKQTVADIITDEPTDETATEEDTATSAANADEPEKGRVPYSRFERKHQEAEEARQQAEYWRQEAERRSQSNNARADAAEDLPDYWKELFGDTDASKKAYKAEQKRMTEIEERAEQRAIEVIEQRQIQQERKFSSNLDSIESRMEGLAEYLGRDLTETEENALLDIVDDYTPKDDDGNYAGELMSFGKAWQIYELQQTQQSAKTNRSRNAVASASGASSKGEPSATEDKNFNPQQWGSWRNRLK